MKSVIKKDPKILLPLSVRFAKEYFHSLCEMQKIYTQKQLQLSKELAIRHRALWTALIMEVGRLFDPYERDGRKVISFKHIPKLEREISELHGEAIIGKILKTRNTFTAHFAEKGTEIVSASEICNSKLKEILNKLDRLTVS